MSAARVKMLEEKIDCDQTVFLVSMKSLEEKYDKLLAAHLVLKKEFEELHEIAQIDPVKKKTRKNASCSVRN